MEILRLESLHKIRDGLLAETINQELARIHADCVDRPRLEKARTLTIQIAITPTGEDPLVAVNVDFKVPAAKLPHAEISRQLKHVARSKGFGFDSDTDSIDHSSDQRRLNGIDNDGDDI